jgi:hypothetical protein
MIATSPRVPASSAPNAASNGPIWPRVGFASIVCPQRRTPTSFPAASRPPRGTNKLPLAVLRCAAGLSAAVRSPLGLGVAIEAAMGAARDQTRRLSWLSSAPSPSRATATRDRSRPSRSASRPRSRRPRRRTTRLPTSASSPARANSARPGSGPRTRAASTSRSSSTTRASRRRCSPRWSRPRTTAWSSSGPAAAPTEPDRQWRPASGRGARVLARSVLPLVGERHRVADFAAYAARFGACGTGADPIGATAIGSPRPRRSPQADFHLFARVAQPCGRVLRGGGLCGLPRYPWSGAIQRSIGRIANAMRSHPRLRNWCVRL